MVLEGVNGQSIFSFIVREVIIDHGDIPEVLFCLLVRWSLLQ